MIKNILFDFGGVIINIDPMSLVHELTSMGIQDGFDFHEYLLEENAYVRLETGTLSPDGFRQMFRDFTGLPLKDDQINHAWNSIIQDIPQKRIDLLERIKKHYRTFLLSNSNPIHYDHYNRYVIRQYGFGSLDEIFEKAWFSFRLGLYKPQLEIFRKILDEGQIMAEETLFIDDSLENVVAAEKTGMKGYHLEEGKDVVDIFKNGILEI